MRTRILASLLVPLAVAPVWTARAQQQDGAEDEASQGGETEGAEVADEPERPTRVAVPPGTQGRESAPGEVHTVESGDTLWDLSQRYLGSPWYWPKVWSYNPEIANPHWIYPGNQVRFFAAGEEVPSRVEAGAPVDVAPATEIPEETNAVTVSGKIGYDGSSATTVTTQGFVTARELDEAGRIEGASTGSVMLSAPDQVYVRFKRNKAAKVGDRYVVFHTQQEVKHPVTGARAGYLTQLLGSLRVVALNDQVVTAQIMETWDPISRGDLVGPYGEHLTTKVSPKPNAKEVLGVVLVPMVPYLTMVAENYFVVVDRGSADGVQLGNTFTIERKGDPSNDVLGKPRTKPGEVAKNDRVYPWERIGQCMVTELREHSANCLLSRTLQEIGPGDRAVMRVGGSPTASR
ncbi:peptidoglycan-binding protein [Corallococcus sp. H22C18031201]|uniref:LysM peptidoglycan-binding domain-containing protein n=1 Tax=Citreicoccus inhibens TaxID=2849499 RepID=UPI000E71496A|nr:LysM peptidoglycan-binding domain-containing protein [Citreicoccus inhibens]MBU8900471.1 LysM peptidoglycan-binding domain-containing protein [Citreicoccus inhibens]RJS20726.1 peptidoglycan-binding protein [Corallococcus sp. H22C18031201]